MLLECENLAIRVRKEWFGGRETDISDDDVTEI